MLSIKFNPEVNAGHIFLASGAVLTATTIWATTVSDIKALQETTKKHEQSIEKIVEFNQNLAIIQAQQKVMIEVMLKNKNKTNYE